MWRLIKALPMALNINLKELKALAASREAEHSNLFKKLKRMPDGTVDKLFQDLHYSEFETFDCLECANCCSSISPSVTYNDVERLAKALRKRPSELVSEYFKVDSDGDYVFRTSPCPFLMPDNYCMVYDSRPKACREYPHTNRRRMKQIFEITKKNIAVCPLVYSIVEQLKGELK